MKKMLTLAIASSTIALSGAALAVDKEDVANLAKAKITLTDAIGIAEKHHAGSKAIEASLDESLNRTIYEVTVLHGEVGYDVDIDAVTGEVISSKTDAVD